MRTRLRPPVSGRASVFRGGGEVCLFTSTLIFCQVSIYLSPESNIPKHTTNQTTDNKMT